MLSRTCLVLAAAAALLAAAPAADARLYRAKDNLFALTLPDSYRPLSQLAASGDVVESSGFEFREGLRRVFLGVEVQRVPAGTTLAALEAGLRAEVGARPKLERSRAERTGLSGVPGFRMAYSFTYEDDPAFRLHRDDVVVLLDGRRVFLYVEANEDGRPAALRDFQAALLSFKSPKAVPAAVGSGLKERVSQLSAAGQAAPGSCPSCGKASAAGARFCAFCGKTLAEAYAPPEPAADEPTDEQLAQPAAGDTGEADEGADGGLPPPPVVVAGEPPLTEKSLAIWRMLMEWTCRSRMTLTQEQRLRQAVINEYRAGGDRRDEMVALDDSFDPEKLFATPADKAAALRVKLRGQFADVAARGRNDNPEADVFARVFTAIDARLVDGTPPLTQQVSDAACELLGFAGAVAALGERASPLSPVDGVRRATFERRLREGWRSFDGELRKKLADVVYLWSDVRMGFEIAQPADRAALAAAFRERVRDLARRPGGTPETNPSTLGDRVVTICVDKPGALVTVASALDEACRSVLSQAGAEGAEPAAEPPDSSGARTVTVEPISSGQR